MDIPIWLHCPLCPVMQQQDFMVNQTQWITWDSEQQWATCLLSIDGHVESAEQQVEPDVSVPNTRNDLNNKKSSFGSNSCFLFHPVNSPACFHFIHQWLELACFFMVLLAWEDSTYTDSRSLICLQKWNTGKINDANVGSGPTGTGAHQLHLCSSNLNKGVWKDKKKHNRKSSPPFSEGFRINFHWQAV